MGLRVAGPNGGHLHLFLAAIGAVLLAVSGFASVVLSLMPDAFYRLLAYPNAIAMIALGVSLWRSQRAASSVETSAAETSPSPVVVTSDDHAPAVR